MWWQCEIDKWKDEWMDGEFITLLYLKGFRRDAQLMGADAFVIRTIY